MRKRNVAGGAAYAGGCYGFNNNGIASFIAIPKVVVDKGGGASKNAGLAIAAIHGEPKVVLGLLQNF